MRLPERYRHPRRRVQALLKMSSKSPLPPNMMLRMTLVPILKLFLVRVKRTRKVLHCSRQRTPNDLVITAGGYRTRLLRVTKSRRARKVPRRT